MGRPFHNRGGIGSKNLVEARSLQGTIEAQMKDGQLTETDTWSDGLLQKGW